MKTREVIPSIQALVDHIGADEHMRRHVSRVKNWLREQEKPELTAANVMKKIEQWKAS